MVTTVLGYLVVAEFFFLEGRIRSGAEARSVETGQFDQRSTLYIGIAIFVSLLALLAAWLFNWLRIGILLEWVGWLGLMVAACGLLLRWWANRVLGAFYTRTLKVAENQVIVREGPYRLIRHPGNLGSILMWTGAAAATTNWIVVLIALVAMLSAYVYRIQAEEKMLLATNADYADYRAHTWRLMPFLY